MVKLQTAVLETSQYDALQDFYNSTNGPSWVWKNFTLGNESTRSIPWNFQDPASDPCSDHWQGVDCSCGVKTCDITDLVLEHHNISRTIPATIRNLPQLQVLNMRGNNLMGSLTDAIGYLSSLRSLDLSMNMFTNTIPATIGNLTSLQSLTLQSNLFVAIPDAFFSQLISLRELDLANNLINGTIPETIGSLTELINLALNTNDFYSPLPASLSKLTNLQSIDLSYNYKISGSFPTSLFALNNMSNIIFTHMDLSGTLPDNFTAFPFLKSINVAYNRFFGSLPASIGNCSQLENIEVIENFFDGSIPRSFESLHRMVAFYFESNSFTGTLDPLIGMHALTLSQGNVNFFNGTIDQVFNKLNHTNEFYLANNLFTGPLPCNVHWNDIYLYEFFHNYFNEPLSECFQNITMIHNFIAYNNFIPGPLPDPFCPSPVLTYFTMESNVLSGSLPASITQLHGLLQMFLNDNFLTGPLPESIGSLQRLVILSLSNNSMTGPLPAQLSELTYIQEIFLQSNQFTGRLDQFDNTSLLHDLNNVDLSDNKFTGTIPVNLFRLNSSLQSVSLSKNCFYGSIPSEICFLTNLTSLSLDGLSTSSNCQAKNLFQGPFSFIHSFEVTHFMKSSIPSCVFELPRIQLIHLSGNGLTGMIPSSVIITSSLTDLSLSHNQLSGTIPLIFQRKDNWNNLDLSYNKLSGNVDDSFHSFTADSSLSLDINRLSGSIPSSIINMSSISILSGNIFSCNVFSPENTLPVHDSDYANYSCGSDNVNFIIYAWLILIVVIPSILLCLARLAYPHMTWAAWRKKLWNKENFRVSRKFSLAPFPRQSDQIILSTIAADNSTGNPTTSSVQKGEEDETSAEELNDTPIVSPTAHSKNTNISRLFGFFEELRSFFLLICLFIFLILLPVYLVLKRYFSSYQFEYAWALSGLLLSGETAGVCLFIFLSVFVLFILILVDRHIDWIAPVNSSSRALKEERSLMLLSCAVYFLIFLANATVMTVVDFSYVYIVLNYSSTAATLSALFLAVFRIITNNILLFNAIPFMWTLFQWLRPSLPYPQNMRQGAYEHSLRDISFLQQLVLLNNILIPILAVIFILPDCFYYLLFQPPSVTSSYTYVSCKEYYPIAGLEHICVPETESVTYVPAFSYSYQCSSKIAINYAPVYLLMFLFVGLIVPLYRIVLKVCYDLLNEQPAKGGRVISFMLKTLDRLMSARWKVLPIDKPQVSSSEQFFHKLQFTVQMNSYLAICITFGGLFPPLAFIACLSILTVLALEEIGLKDLLSRSKAVINARWVEEQLEGECAESAPAFALTIQTAVLVACGLYGYVVFDAIGDTAGWVVALPFTLLLVLVPLLFILARKLMSRFFRTSPQSSSPERLSELKLGNGNRLSELQMIRPLSLISAGNVTENPILQKTSQSSESP